MVEVERSVPSFEPYTWALHNSFMTRMDLDQVARWLQRNNVASDIVTKTIDALLRAKRQFLRLSRDRGRSNVDKQSI